MDWLLEQLNWFGFWDATTRLREQHRGKIRDVESDPQFSQPPIYVAEICLQVADQQRCLGDVGIMTVESI